MLMTDPHDPPSRRPRELTSVEVISSALLVAGVGSLAYVVLTALV